MGLLDGKVALITGTAGGQGRAACLAFAREGAKVIGCDLQAAGNEATVQAVLAAGGEMVGFAPVDLTGPAAVERFVGDAVACFGGLDIVYNNAGGPRFGPVDQISVDDWRATIAVELDTVFFVTRYAWPHLVARGGGVILNISSVAGMMGFPQPPMAAHAAAKAGVIGLTRQLAVEGAPVGIRAVTISPGAVLSREGDLDQTQRNAVTDRTLLKRWGRPEEVVETAVFLASDRASYITGANIPIEGGATAW
ncbi:MAG: SDR family oxidoreductase [Alphaproteobacteria bacterium]|nr:SDR family oxidoreductase [Alphaproteobacteria bacterium]MBU1515142.1 SDR family oxidoreductase [Alphaproteobacteria bacterium]MBU2092272.1 SDR family oxidoreductase [Alphaproteobacteria bacterium]MBU2152866.1 SDR family oxidoreductase [Alphaproteobacteria bacterium]MBU2305697.1 SDR family oxidoreductase [Alphaproteobacteria bacterium]